MKLGFIFSLPRAGSTYTQRVLSASDQVATTSEPWLLPPLMSIRHGDQPYAQWGYDHARIGIEDMLSKLDDPEAAWRGAVRAASEAVFSRFATPGQTYIDKTPRNAEFAREIMATFPDARFLFLWRNPLSVVKSINQTWGDGHWKAYFYEYDLRKGLNSLVEAYRQSAGDNRVLAVRYEDLVAAPELHWPRIFDHFGVDYDPQFAKSPPKLIGRMGDVTGQEKFAGTSATSVDDWPSAFGSVLRRRWARRYLEELGQERLGIMGYDKTALLGQLKTAPRHFDWTDYLYLPLTPLYHRISPYVWRQALRQENAPYAVR